MRLVEVESDISLSGTVERTLTLDDTGLHGTLANQTGLNISRPFLFMDGRHYPLRVQPGRDEWTVDLSTEDLLTSQRSMSQSYDPRFYYDYRPLAQGQLQGDFAQSLLSPDPARGAAAEPLGPFVCGWVADSPIGSVVLSEPARERITGTFVVADIALERTEDAPMPWRNLPIWIDNVPWAGMMVARGSRLPQGYYWGAEAIQIHPQEQKTIAIEVPWRLLQQEPGDLAFDLYWDVEDGQHMLFIPEGQTAHWAKGHIQHSSTSRFQHENVNVTTYHVPDWRDYFREKDRKIVGKVIIVPSDWEERSTRAEQALRQLREAQQRGEELTPQQRQRLGNLERTMQRGVPAAALRQRWGRFTLSARIQVAEVELSEGEWKAWP
jgi:hypothetical protein